MSEKMKNLMVRTLSGAVLAVVVLGAVIWSQWSFGALLLAMLVAGMLEFYGLAEKQGNAPQKIVGMAAGIVLFALNFAFVSDDIEILGGASQAFACGMAFMLLLIPAMFICELYRKQQNPASGIGTTLMGVCYIALPLSLMCYIPIIGSEVVAAGCVGVRRTTGQHPGGLVVIPQENEIWDFCPVQHPADDPQADQITTHFEYHSMEENLLKLDMLGHDDPTMIRMMEDMTGIDAKTIPLDDKDTMSIFISSKVLGYEDDKILGPTGAVAIPEFNTRFTRGMLMDTMPTRFDTLLRLSGFSHGTDVWLGNAKDLITSKTATVDQAIGCRDDIMLYLISCGMPEKRSFKIMEAVRKGRGLPEGAEEEMKAAGVPEWYIGSCKKIKYLFPKAHAVAYVMMAFRIAWFKVHHPLAFYSAYFYRRSQKGGFDAVLITHGKDAVVANIDAIENNENATDKDEDLLTTLEVAYEYYIRGFEFLPISIYDSHATKFIIKDGKLLPPFVAISGLGENAAWDLMRGREGKTFLSVEEVAAACPKVSKTHIQMLREAGAFGDLPDTSQVSFF